MNNKPPEPNKQPQTSQQGVTPPKLNEGLQGANTGDYEPKFNPLTYTPPKTNQKQMMEPLLPNNQSMKSTQQAPQLKQPAYAGLPTNLLAPYSEGSLEAMKAQSRRLEEQGYELRLVYDDKNKKWTQQYIQADHGGMRTTSPTNAQKEQLATIYDSILAEQNQKYAKLIQDLPTMSDQILEVLVINRETYPYEIRQMILSEYKVRINYHDRLRNPSKYPGQESPLFPREGTYLPPVE